MTKELLKELFSGASFPNLDKAREAEGIKALLKEFKQGESIYEPANKKRKELEKQYRGDFRAFVASLGVATTAGNKNSCVDKKQLGKSAESQQEWANKNTKAIVLPSYGGRKVAPKKLPKSRGVSPVANSSGKQPRHPSIARAKFGNLNTQESTEYKLETVKPLALDGKDNFKNFVAGQAGFKGKLIDKSIFITQDGTPQYGDDRINQANQDNLSANLATTPPTLDFQKKVSTGATIDSNNLVRKQPGQIQDKGDTIGNIAKLGAIGVVVTGLLFLIRDILGVVSFIINVSTLTSTVTNISQSFLAIFDSIASLMGLGNEVSKPISETFDGILNNVFGKSNVDYAKYNFARINAIFTAGANILGKVRSTSAALAEGIEIDVRNTSEIGNALRRCGVVDEKLTIMDEKIAVNINKSQLKILNDKLAKVTNVSSELSGIASDIKTAKAELEQIDKDKAEKDKAEAEKKTGAEKAEKEAIGKPVDVPNLSSGGT